MEQHRRCRTCGYDNGEGGNFCSRCGSPLVSEEDHSSGHAQGTIGKYQLIEEIGRGAMARVWRAYDRALDREVAVKVPLFDEGIDPDFREELGCGSSRRPTSPHGSTIPIS